MSASRLLYPDKDARLLHVGFGPQGDILRNGIRRLNAESATLGVTFPGSLPRRPKAAMRLVLQLERVPCLPQ
jgi:hypothetical protein